MLDLLELARIFLSRRDSPDASKARQVAKLAIGSATPREVPLALRTRMDETVYAVGWSAERLALPWCSESVREFDRRPFEHPLLMRRASSGCDRRMFLSTVD